MISELSETLKAEDLLKIVENLNKENEHSLSALWELIVVWLFSRKGGLAYELNHGGRTNPDIFYISEDGIEFAVDVRCVSDKDQHKNNDVRYFNTELASVAKHVGIKSLAGFYVRVEEDLEWPGNKVKLKLPIKNEVRNFIESKIKPFLSEVAKFNEVSRCLDINQDGVEVSIKYEPKSRFFSASFPSYTIAKSLKNNPIYDSLKAKSDQLKKSGFGGLKGVVICDGGCDLITSRMESFRGSNIGLIVDNFLKNQETIGFVIVIYIEENRESKIGGRLNRRFRIKYVAKDACKNLVSRLVENLLSLIDKLPHPISTPKNAVLTLENQKSFPGNTFYGGYSVSNNKVRISSRALLNLITGNLTAEKFLIDHDCAGFYLKNKINQGYMLKSLSIDKTDESDDDWIEFEFEDILDPSVSKYVCNNKKV